ncbi:HNH endonuclease signature motif containing protein [Nocardioides sp. W7]|uniref:HNH endonuclease signature motif containing protein n=1 Tax=Nocardioides sp. W7 TaxID=2931390 RepID=UPI001FD3F84C|nr:HNH endonuclease signature motif containing protein [Nocardioides sp. W7]
MSAIASPPHPVTGLLVRTGENLAAMRDAWLPSLTAEETGRALVETDRLISQLTELQARLAAHADAVDLAGPTGATSTANWLAVQTRHPRTSTHRLTRLAAAVDRDLYAPVRHALADGAINPDQALVITDAIDALPDTVTAEIRDRAVAVLLEEAAHHDARDLRRLGKRILDVVAPETGEAHEAQLLAAEEARAAASARLTMTEDGHGTTHGRFTIPTLHGDLLRKALTAIAAPKHQTATHGPGQGRRPGPERLGRALCELLERLPADHLPQAGGMNATLVVTMTLDDLRRDTAVGQLDTGHRLSAGAVRRLACEAGIIPAVLGARSEVLDLGRKQRLFSKAQRTALALRDRGCTADGCDWPPALCHAHHHDPWSHGGPTNLDNARLLCPRHHTRAHDPTWETRHLPGGKVAFHRRT